MNLIQAFIIWFLIGLVYCIIVAVLHCFKSIWTILIKYGIAPLTCWIHSFVHLYPPMSLALIMLSYDFGLELENEDSWVIGWFCLSVVFLLVLFVLPFLMAIGIAIRFKKIKLGGIWYFSNESFFFWGLKESNFIA